MNPQGRTFYGYYERPYVHSWPGKVKPARSKGCGKHRKGAK